MDDLYTALYAMCAAIIGNLVISAVLLALIIKKGR